MKNKKRKRIHKIDYDGFCIYCGRWFLNIKLISGECKGRKRG